MALKPFFFFFITLSIYKQCLLVLLFKQVQLPRVYFNHQYSVPIKPLVILTRTLSIKLWNQQQQTMASTLIEPVPFAHNDSWLESTALLSINGSVHTFLHTIMNICTLQLTFMNHEHTIPFLNICKYSLSSFIHNHLHRLAYVTMTQKKKKKKKRIVESILNYLCIILRTKKRPISHPK